MRRTRVMPRARRGLGLAVAVLGLLLATAGHGAAARAARTHTVTIEGTRFEPQSLTIKAGDSVVWVNKDPFPHTVTSDSAVFDSQQIPTEKSWRYTPAKVGTFPYKCVLHPTMTATLKVE